MVEVVIRRSLGVHGREVGGENPVARRRAVHHRHHTIDGDAGADVGPVEGADKRLGEGEARSFDHDVIRRLVAFDQHLHRGDEILGHRAADAAIRQLDHVLLGAGLVAAAFQDAAIDAEIAEFIDDQRDALAVRVFQQVADQGRLAGAEKAGDDGGGDFLGHGGSSNENTPGRNPGALAISIRS